jgi:protein gp37
MAERTEISWTDATFNPWIGCTQVSPGCDGCYAKAMMDDRYGRAKWGAGQPRVRTSEANWRQPLSWNRKAEREGRRLRVFCASLADVFDNEVPDAWRLDLFRLIRGTPHLDWQLLTKRIGNAPIMLGNVRLLADEYIEPFPWPNVWIGATVVNQEEYDRDIGKLLRLPAAVHFLSVEPMLGPIDMRMGGASMPDYADHRPLASLDWVIVGGESGPKARPAHPDWFRSLRDQCAAAGVPFHFKQWGEWVPVDRNPDGTVAPVEEIVGLLELSEGWRIRTDWLSPNGGVVGHSFARVGKAAAESGAERQLFFCSNPSDYPAGATGETEHYAYRVTRVERKSAGWLVYGHTRARRRKRSLPLA